MYLNQTIWLFVRKQFALFLSFRLLGSLGIQPEQSLQLRILEMFTTSSLRNLWNTVNVIYLACTIFDVSQIFCYLVWIWFGGWFVSTGIQTFINAHLAVYLIWRRNSTVKGAKKDTLPNVIRLQYSIWFFFFKKKNTDCTLKTV